MGIPNAFSANGRPRPRARAAATLPGGRPMRMRGVLAAVLLASALTGCLSAGEADLRPADRDTDPDPAPLGALILDYPYTAAGGRLLLQSHIDTVPGCLGDSAVPEIDTVTDHPLEFSLSGSVLLLFDPSQFVADSGSVIEYALRLERRSDGEGMEGIWSLTDLVDRAGSGALSAEESARRELFLDQFRAQIPWVNREYRLRQGRFRIYEDRKSALFAEAEWHGAFPMMGEADSLSFDMDFRIVDPYTVEYKGRRTGETVRVTEKPGGEMDFVSDRPNHPAVHYSRHPTRCPAPGYPVWYWDFRLYNRKPAAPAAPKAAKTSVKVGIPPRIGLSL